VVITEGMSLLERLENKIKNKHSGEEALLAEGMSIYTHVYL
jgi:hypothetical protein